MSVENLDMKREENQAKQEHELLRSSIMTHATMLSDLSRKEADYQQRPEDPQYNRGLLLGMIVGEKAKHYYSLDDSMERLKQTGYFAEESGAVHQAPAYDKLFLGSLAAAEGQDWPNRLQFADTMVRAYRHIISDGKAAPEVTIEYDQGTGAMVGPVIKLSQADRMTTAEMHHDGSM